MLIDFKYRRITWGVCTLGIHTIYCKLAREHRRLKEMNTRAVGFIETPSAHDWQLLPGAPTMLVYHLVEVARMTFPLVTCPSSRGKNRDAQYSHIVQFLYQYVMDQKRISNEIQLLTWKLHYLGGLNPADPNIVPLWEKIEHLKESNKAGCIKDIRHNQVDRHVTQAANLCFVPTALDVQMRLITSSNAANQQLSEYDDFMNAKWTTRFLNAIPFYGASNGFINRLMQSPHQ